MRVRFHRCLAMTSSVRSRACTASAQPCSRVGKVLGLRLTPTLEFIPDALPRKRGSLGGCPAKRQGEGRGDCRRCAGRDLRGRGGPPPSHDEGRSRREAIGAHGSSRPDKFVPRPVIDSFRWHYQPCRCACDAWATPASGPRGTLESHGDRCSRRVGGNGSLTW